MKKGWEEVMIGDECLVTDFVSSGSFASLRENVKYNYEKDYAVLVRTTDFAKNWQKDFVYVSKDSFDFLRKSNLREGDVVISNVGAPGVTFKVPDLGQPMTLGPNAILVRTNDEERLRQDYIYRYFESPLGQEMIQSITSGTTQLKFNKTNFRDLRIPVPPATEQQRIVTKLDAAFGALREAEGHVERNRANARELFESYLNGVFEGKGDGWEVYTLPDLAENLDSRRVPITKSDRKAGPFPYYGASGVVDHVHDFIFDEECLLISEDGANLLMRSTPIAFSVSGKYWVNNHAHILRFPERATQRLVEHYLESIDLSPWITGAAQPKLNQSAMNSIPIWLPKDIKERGNLVHKLDELQRETKQLEATYQQKLRELEGLKKGLLGAAFRGEL